MPPRHVHPPAQRDLSVLGRWIDPAQVKFYSSSMHPEQGQGHIRHVERNITWSHIPAETQHAVQEWFQLFVCDLHGLGYAVCWSCQPNERWINGYDLYDTHFCLRVPFG